LVQTNIRSYATRIRQIRSLRVTADELMQDNREIVPKQFVTNLWSRYRKDTKDQKVRQTFAEWLDGKRTEDTYTWKGHQFSTRQMWSSRVVKEALRPEHNPVGKISVDWFIQQIEVLINAKQAVQPVQPYVTIALEYTNSRKHTTSASFRYTTHYPVDRHLYEPDEPDEMEEEK